MSKRLLEIRAGEGGTDSCIFVAELALAYAKLVDRKA